MNRLDSKNFRDFRRKGYFIFRGVFSEEEIKELRHDYEENLYLTSRFKSGMITVTSDELVEMPIENPVLKSFIKERVAESLLPFQVSVDAKLLPPFELMKNFIKRRTTSSWHRDCLGEEKYEFCQTRLRSPDYFFSKVAIYLQSASEYGGTIKVVPYSHLVFRSSFSSLLQKFSLGLLYLIQKSTLVRGIFELIASRDIEIELGDLVIFDSRLLHAGKSLSKRVEAELNWTSEKTPELPADKTKYALYAHFGNKIGHESFLYDRLRKSHSHNLKVKSELTRYSMDFKVELKDLTQLDPK